MLLMQVIQELFSWRTMILCTKQKIINLAIQKNMKELQKMEVLLVMEELIRIYQFQEDLEIFSINSIPSLKIWLFHLSRVYINFNYRMLIFWWWVVTASGKLIIKYKPLNKLKTKFNKNIVEFKLNNPKNWLKRLNNFSTEWQQRQVMQRQELTTWLLL